MNLTRTTTLRLIRILIIAILACGIITYAVFRSLDYARGPSITIIEPTDGSSTASTTVTIRGHVDRVNAININGNPIFMDVAGNFTQTLIIFPGLNKLMFSARDQFGRIVEKKLDIVGLGVLPDQNSQTMTAPKQTSSSTASTTGL